MATSILHIKSEVECHVYLFDEDKGIVTPGKYFNLEVRKGKQELLFVSTMDDTVRCRLFYEVEEQDTDFSVNVKRSQFKQYTPKILDELCLAEQGDARAQYNLGVCYYFGEGVEQDYEEAVKWYRKAAEQGYARAQYNLGVCYYNGEGVEQDYEKAVKLYREAAEQGSSSAQCNLGVCYNNGVGVEQDYEEAVKWYRKAVVQEYAFGQLEGFRSCVCKGNGVEQVYAIAQYYLGMCYYYGEGVKQDYEAAVKLYREAAEQGVADAQCELGLCYYFGEGVEQDYEEAVKWYRKAAEQGYASAQYNLGVCYYNGKGVEQDYEEVVKWYRKAAEQGHPRAQYHLKKLRDEKIEKTAKTPYYLFFDTETTGVPRDYKAPASNTNNWPRLVQLGWILSDENGMTISSGCEIVKPDGFVIPADAARVHGITTQKATREGKTLREVIDSFLKDARQSKIVVGHNISFDQHIVGAELFRLGITDSISNAKSICTMEIGTGFCKIPSYNGYKWPKLQELYRKLFGTNFEDAHDAMADIKATKKCFFEMKRLGIVK